MRSIAALFTLAAAIPASAANVYVLSSGDAPTDAAVIAALTSRGHNCTLGVVANFFDGTQPLDGYSTVYLQDNANWALAPVPPSGQQALVTWVRAGGRLVTCEWTGYYTFTGGTYATLAPIMPVLPQNSYGTSLTTAFDQATPDAAIDAGLPSSLTFALTSYAGTESYLTTRPGATTYFTSSIHAGATGLAGWAQGSGSVYSFSTTGGPDQLGDPNFGRLFANVMGPANIVCYANCDGSTNFPLLDVSDFVCFQARFAAGDLYANCDGSTTPPVLNVNDFICFHARFVAGCQ